MDQIDDIKKIFGESGWDALWDSYNRTVLGTGGSGGGSLNHPIGSRGGGNALSIEEQFRKMVLEQNYNDDPITAHRKSVLALRDATKEAEEAQKELNKASSDEETLKALEKFNFARQKMQYAQSRMASDIQNLTRNLDAAGQVFRQFGRSVDDLTQSWDKADQAAANYAKSVAMSAKGMAALRDNTINNVVKSKIGIRFDTSADELLKMQQNYVDSIGRNVGVSNEGQENMAAMNKVMGDRGNDMIVKLENFGLSINDAAERSGKMFSTASKYGLDFTKYSKNFLENITIAQNYTFKNGLKGLESMAKKATAIKLDMKQVAQFAEKVQTVEGAMDVASKLQVLGGSFAGLADPLGMLNEGLNDMEGLTDRVTGMIKGMGSFNRKTGEIEVSSFNKQRIKAAASAMGMSYDNLMESVNAGARREEIDRQLRVSGKSGLSDDMKELIRNTGTIQNGVAGVNINGEFKKLGDVKEEDYGELVKQNQSDSDNIKDIATMLRGAVDMKSGYTKQRSAVDAKLMGWLGASKKMVFGTLGSMTAMLYIMSGGNFLKQLFGTVTNSIKTFGSWGKQYKFWGTNRSLINAAKSGRIPLAGGGAPAPGGGGGAPVPPPAPGGTFKPYSGTHGLARSIERGALKVFGKKAVGRTIASNIIRNAKVGAGVGIAAGIAGAALQGWRDKRIESGKGKKGDSADSWMTVGSSALKFAGIGASTIGLITGPVIGAAIGGVVGTVVGITQKAKRKAEDNLENALSAKGLEVRGKYSKKEMKNITTSLATGKLDDETRAKLIGQGDSAILDEIDKRRIKEAKIAAIGANPMKSNGNEAISLSPSARRGQENKPQDININIDGKLKLEGANGKDVDVTKELMAALKNPSFIKNTLMPIIMKGLNENKYGTSVPRGINSYAFA